jgi:hypothetical protein
MIKLSNEKFGISCEVSVEGYEFPEVHTGWDGNWLLVKIDIVENNKNFSKILPVITTFDIEKMAEWFEDISRKTIPKNTTLCFLEPDLKFHFLGYKEPYIQIEVELNHGFKPKYILDCNDEDDETSSISFELYSDLENCTNINKNIRAILLKYPPRGKLTE